ncbi:hypothetical protein THAOC_10719, partial [Thalassiosira oceanica]
AVTHEEVAVWAVMSGTDYIPKGMPNEGRVAVEKRMREYVRLSSDNRKAYLKEYINLHPEPNKFQRAHFAMYHDPAYVIVPSNDGMLPKDALNLGEYDIVVGSMTTEHSHRGNFFIPEEDNPKLGFVPETHIASTLELEDDESAKHIDFFRMEKNIKTGEEFKCIEPQMNTDGHEVMPGANIDFGQVPIKFQSDRSLQLYLSCRGICIDNMTRGEVIASVGLMEQFNIQALPRFVLRGGGAYVAVAIFNFENDETADWKHGEEALSVIRSSILDCVDAPGFVNDTFQHAHNSKRQRILKHLKGGSFNLKDIKVSCNLKTKLKPNVDFFVIVFTCAPSQKGLGTEGKVYQLGLAFAKIDGVWVLMPTPYSLCGCPVGVLDICAHRGGALLLIWAIRNCYKRHGFDDLCQLLPANIHAVAIQYHMVHYIYPAPYSKRFKEEFAIKKEAAKKTKKKSQDDPNIDADDDAELEQINLNELKSAKGAALLDVCNDVRCWCKGNEIRLQTAGTSDLYDPERSRVAAVEAASMDSDTGSLIRRHFRYKRYAEGVQKGEITKSNYGYFADGYQRGDIKLGGDVTIPEGAEFNSLARALPAPGTGTIRSRLACR